MAEADDILDRYYGPPQPNKLAGYNQELMQALMNPPPNPSQKFGWAKDHPTVAAFLREALTYAPLGFPAARVGPRFAPEHTVEAYHGSPNWKGDAIRSPFWMHEGKTVPHQFAGEKGAIVPVEVDTSNYLRIPEGSLLEKFDQRYGHTGSLERDTPNWLFGIANALGKSGVRWESSFHDYGPAMVAFDPRTVRGRYGAFNTAAEKPAPLPPPAPLGYLPNSDSQ